MDPRIKFFIIAWKGAIIETVRETLMIMTRKRIMVVEDLNRTVQIPQKVAFMNITCFLEEKRTTATGHDSKDVTVSKTHIIV